MILDMGGAEMMGQHFFPLELRKSSKLMQGTQFVSAPLR